jgi:hypothetical protein
MSALRRVQRNCRIIRPRGRNTDIRTGGRSLSQVALIQVQPDRTQTRADLALPVPRYCGTVLRLHRPPAAAGPAPAVTVLTGRLRLVPRLFTGTVTVLVTVVYP